VSQKDLASWFGLGVRHIRSLTAAGVLTHTASGYDLKSSIHSYLTFLRSKTGSVSDERTRLLKSQADMSELKVRLQTNEVVTRESVANETFIMVRRMRDQLFNIPDRTSGLLAAETDQHKIHILLTQEIHSTLTEMSHGFGHHD
jgi:phage terminase Nu1 subunit (DNA packaging protein)